MPPALQDGNVTLRSLEDGDAEELAIVVARAGVVEWWGPADDPERTRDDMRNEGNAFAIVVDDALAGWLGFSEEGTPGYRHAALDIILAPEFQDHGYGRRALALAARWLISERGHHRLTIDPAAHNHRAIRTYSIVGFRPVGVMRQYELGVDGRWHDNLLMDMLAGELR
jgi:aminoglycoside 6'-N-acetyltransferase